MTGSTRSHAISAVIPTYDRPGLLKGSIESILKQTRPPGEIIVVDNGVSSCREVVAQYPGVRYTRIVAGAGVSQARNHGISLARGEWIAFLDDDDRWPPTYLEKALEAIGEATADCWVFRKDRYRNGAIIPYKDPSRAAITVESLVRGIGIGGSNIVVRRSSLNDIGGFDVRFPAGEDAILGLDLILKGYVVRASGATGALTRMHEPGDVHLGASNLAKSMGRYARLMKYREMLPAEQSAKITVGVVSDLQVHAPGKPVRLLLRILRRTMSFYYRIRLNKPRRSQSGTVSGPSNR